MFDDLAAGEAAKQLGSEAAKSVMGNTESILAPMAGEESSSLRTVVSIRNAGAGENQNEIIQSNPSPEFLNSLSFIKKFYPLPAGARAKFTKVTHDNSCNSRHSEAHSPSAKKLQKTRRSARLFCNFEDTFNANENSSEPKESSLFIV